jgi:hypothetical protein
VSAAESIDPALSMDIETMDAQAAEPRVRAPLSPWHQRRALGFGASDVPALLVGLGLRDASSVPGYIAENAKSIRVAGGEMFPRIVLEKAGRKAPRKVGSSANIGRTREVELIAAWAATLTEGDAIDPESVTHASVLPIELTPLVDRECPRLAVSPDGWCRDVLGELVLVEAKCGNAWRDELPWYWEHQIQAQLAATGVSMGVLVLGQQWSRSMEARGPIQAWPVERNERVVAEIREAVRAGWLLVERARQ